MFKPQILSNHVYLRFDIYNTTPSTFFHPDSPVFTVRREPKVFRPTACTYLLDRSQLRTAGSSSRMAPPVSRLTASSSRVGQDRPATWAPPWYLQPGPGARADESPIGAHHVSLSSQEDANPAIPLEGPRLA